MKEPRYINGKIVEFQLPPPSETSSRDDAIRSNVKIHIFVDGKSLCGKYHMAPKHFETTDVGERALFSHPEYFCKKCREKYLNGFSKHITLY